MLDLQGCTFVVLSGSKPVTCIFMSVSGTSHTHKHSVTKAWHFAKASASFSEDTPVTNGCCGCWSCSPLLHFGPIDMHTHVYMYCRQLVWYQYTYIGPPSLACKCKACNWRRNKVKDNNTIHHTSLLYGATHWALVLLCCTCTLSAFKCVVLSGC